MPAKPQNCFICRLPWYGAGPICLNCMSTMPHVAPTRLACSYCGGMHADVDCLDLQLRAQKLQAQQDAARRSIYRNAVNASKIQSSMRTKPFIKSYATNYHQLKACPQCKGNYLIESKAGSVCSSCKTVVHHPCRNCTSNNTRGIAGDNTQFIECNDCLFIE